MQICIFGIIASLVAFCLIAMIYAKLVRDEDDFHMTGE